MLLNNKSNRRSSNINNGQQQNPNLNFNPSPPPLPHLPQNSFQDTQPDPFFNESAFVPAAQSTYHQPNTPHQLHTPSYYQPNTPHQNQQLNQQQNQHQQQNYYEPQQNAPQNNQFYSPNQNQVPNNPPQNQRQLRGQTPQMNNQNQQMNQNGIYNPAEMFNDPMASMAVKYGSSLAGQGKDYVAQNVDRWFSISKLKFYFAVDTTYVFKKLILILFPFINKDWSMKYSQSEAVPPKLDVNAPDLYIPIMSYVTYLLIVGICLGMQKKFTPELLGIQASSALGWFVIEVVLIFIMMQILSIKSALKTFDIMSFCGYKYFGMIFCLVGSLTFASTGYTIVLCYMCLAITYFMVRNLKLMILTTSEVDGQNGEGGSYQGDAMGGHLTGNKRRIYVLLFISLLQPLFMWWLTRHLVA